MNPEQKEKLDKWLEGRPPIIKELCYRFPPGTRFEIEGVINYVVSYNEDGSVGVSIIDPRKNYELATSIRQIICAECLPTEKDIVTNEYPRMDREVQ